jgi:hypothetical protein
LKPAVLGNKIADSLSSRKFNEIPLSASETEKTSSCLDCSIFARLARLLATILIQSAFLATHALECSNLNVRTLALFDLNGFPDAWTPGSTTGTLTGNAELTLCGDL